uniref:Uncharacterized protein n=1 Tax=Pristionchus pacificus TaxID=54126 RepID=A0A8R1Z913_PRIPA
HSPSSPLIPLFPSPLTLHLNQYSMDTSLSFSQHIINAIESDYLIECVNQYKEVVVNMANERSSEANSARMGTWTLITDMFNDKFGVDVTTKALKSNLSYRQAKLKKNPFKYKQFREWQSNPCKSEKQMEKELGRGDFVLLQLFSDDFEKAPKRKLDESEMRNEWNSNENESSPFPAEAYFVGVEPKEEMDNHLFDVNEDSRHSEEIFGIKRSRLSHSQLPQSITIHPPSMAVNKVDEESALRLELLRAQIELTKTQQSAAEKQMEANISMIKAMNRMMERIEMKKEESNDQSSVTSLISIMKEMIQVHTHTGLLSYQQIHICRPNPLCSPSFPRSFLVPSALHLPS